ncbi:MAG: hypothetical protein ACXWH5_13390, partial [Actinomycetota bacterium]
STVPVLRFLASLIQEGSILLFDDWNCFDRSDQKGERRAFREFLAKNPQFAAEKWTSFGRRGQAFVLHAQSAPARGSESRSVADKPDLVDGSR